MASTLSTAERAQQQADRRARHLYATTAYRALLTESRRIKKPTAYLTDLTTHDRQQLRDVDPALGFGWVLREFGTHFLMGGYAYDIEWAEAVKREAGDSPDYYWYWYDGEQLLACTPDQVIARLGATLDVTAATTALARCQADLYKLEREVQMRPSGTSWTVLRGARDEEYKLRRNVALARHGNELARAADFPLAHADDDDDDAQADAEANS